MKLIPLIMSAAVAVLPLCACNGTADPKDAVLSFDSFDGGGPAYSVALAQPDLVSYTCEHRYNDPNHDELCGAGYDVIYTFHGLHAGSTVLTVTADSPIMEAETKRYRLTVGEDMTVTIEPAS